MKKIALPLGLVTATLLLLVAIYAPGLSGPFVFDDYSNATLMTIKEGSSASRWVEKALENKSGLLRRPVANLSFLVNHALDGYPSALQTRSYKATNLLIHGINAVLCYVLVWQLLSLTRCNRQTAIFVASLAAAVWAIHPLQVSTVLYVTQRMTQLSATFSLLAVIGYLLVRSRPRKPLFTTLLAILAVGTCCALAVLSKENGALLPVLFVVCELTVLQSFPLSGRSDRKSAMLILAILPIALGMVYFFSHFNSLMSGYAVRDFDLYERVLSQIHVMGHYLKAILIPVPSHFGFYLDDMPVVRTASAATYAISAAFLAALGTALLLRRSAPLIAFAILWFFAGHLLESTVLPLELAFEHRNYLPLLGPALLVAVAIGNMQSETIRPRVLITIGLALVLTLSFVTLRRTTTWATMDSFLLSEVEFRSGSFRANSEMVAYLSFSGYHTDARNHLEMMKWRFAGDARLASLELLLTCRSGQLITAERKQSILSLAAEPSRNYESYRTFQKVAELKQSSACSLVGAQDMADIAEVGLRTALQAHPENLGGINQWRMQYAVWLVAANQLEAAKQQIEKVLEASPNSTQALLSMANLELRRKNIALAEQYLRKLESHDHIFSGLRAPIEQLRQAIAAARQNQNVGTLQ